jgi:two-component system CheB/CheR fusion protein
MHGEKAIGIVLSGTGPDGALGMKRIKEWNGLTIAQDPDEAEYDGMPRSAIGTGMVDFVLPIGEMPTHLLQFANRRPALQLKEDGEPAVESAQEMVQRILTQLRGHTGHDFSSYKSSTVNRRIARRMQILQIDELHDYLELLRRNRQEIQALYKDLLITVTNFFRDREAFAYLEENVIPLLFRDKGAGDQVRVWVVGCATGEEAYSIAILLLEYAGRLDFPPEIQIFASDLSDEALARAREGLYTEVIVADVSPERLERFFSQEAGGYRVKKVVRESVLFAPHNLLKDPPFSRIDLVSCRNLLIYFKRDAQGQILELLHYALRPEGYLFLGPSESVEKKELFREVDKKASVFQTVPGSEPYLPALPLSPPIRADAFSGALEQRGVMSSVAIYRRMLERYASPSILINADYDIVHLSELAGRFLQQPGGEPTNNILRRILPPLRLELTTALYRAFQNQATSVTKPIRITVEGRPQQISLRVYPASDAGLSGFALIVFEGALEVAEPEEPPGAAEDGPVQELEEELEQTKKRLQAMIEEFETSREEMKAANEELLSMNEELRSTAEELETSKEELQSMNEELITLNQENKNKVEELSHLTGDLQNLLMATGIATLFLDRELRIRRFTPRVSELFNILVSDQGRPLSHLTHQLGYDDLLEDAATVLRTLVPIERELRSKGGRWFLTHILPYRTIEDRIDGVVITFVDINEIARTQRELERRTQQQAVVARLGRLALSGATLDDLFQQAAQQTCETMGLSFCEVLELQPDEQSLFLKAGYGWEPGVIEQLIVPAEAKSQTKYTVEAKAPILIEDWSQEKRLRLPAYLADRGVVSSASVGIPGLQRPYGALRMHSTEKYSFSGDEVEFIQAVAHLLAEAVERLQFEMRLKALNETLEQRVEQRTEQVRDLASELIVTEQRVRQRISQVLHADLQQLIFATQMTLQFVEQALSPEEHAATLAELQQARSMVDEALGVTRQLTLDLSPPILQNQDLGEALQWLVRHMSELHKLDVELQLQQLPEMSGNDMALLLFQIVRELLFNVVKHAGVNEAQVKVFSEDNRLVVQVVDQGAGFDVSAVLEKPSEDGGYGLHSMSERLGLFGSQMGIRSEPGKGTTITVTVPQDPVGPPKG